MGFGTPADPRPGVGGPGGLRVAHADLAGVRVEVADVRPARDLKVDEVARPLLPLVGRIVRLDPGPVVVVTLGADVLLGDDDVAVVRPDRLDDGHVPGRADPEAAAVPLSHRADRRNVVDQHSVRGSGLRPLTAIAQQIAGLAHVVHGGLDIGGVVRALVTRRHPPVGPRAASPVAVGRVAVCRAPGPARAQRERRPVRRRVRRLVVDDQRNGARDGHQRYPGHCQQAPVALVELCREPDPAPGDPAGDAVPVFGVPIFRHVNPPGAGLRSAGSG